MKYIAEMFERYKRSGDTSFAGGLMYEASKEWDAYLAENSVEVDETPEPEPGQLIPTSVVNEPVSTSQEHGQMFHDEAKIVKGIKESEKRAEEEAEEPEEAPVEEPAAEASEDEATYEANTVDELQDELKRRKLKVSGNKKELIDRLEADDKENA